MELMLRPNYLRTLLRLVAVSDSPQEVLSKNANKLGGLVKNQKSYSTSSRVRGNEDSTLASGNLASCVSADRIGGTVNLQLHHGSAAHYHWIRGPRVRNSYTGHGSDSEAAVQAATGSLRWIGLASRGADHSRILYLDHRQPGDRMGPSAGCYGHLWDGDCGNLHVNEARLSL